MVSTAPIPFVDIPRQAGEDLVDAVAPSAEVSTAIDTNFSKVNAWAGPFADKYKVTEISSILTFGTGWSWYSTAGLYCNGWIVGGVRALGIMAKYSGASVTADSLGGISDLTMGTITDQRFWPGQTVIFSGVTSTGTGLFQFESNGVLKLIGLSYKSLVFSSGMYGLFNFVYIPRSP